MSLAEPVNGPAWALKLISGGASPLGLGGPAEEASFAPVDDGDDGIARFRTTNHFETLFRTALEDSATGAPDNPVILVLDAGTGANAVAPCLRIFRGAHIVAADRTGKDFAALRSHLRQSGASDRVVCLQMEPEAELVQPGTFDLVVGVFVLHRLVDPDRAMASAMRALRPGGHAIFMEPFDGYGLIRLAFERICAEADLRGQPLAPALNAALRSTIAEIAGRTMPDPTRPGFDQLDQKWLFSRESLAAGARQVGFSQVWFTSHNDHPALYRDFAEVMLRQMTGVSTVALPDWAWAILDSFDRALPPPVKRLLMLEGTMVLTK